MNCLFLWSFGISTRRKRESLESAGLIFWRYAFDIPNRFAASASDKTGFPVVIISCNESTIVAFFSVNLSGDFANRVRISFRSIAFSWALISFISSSSRTRVSSFAIRSKRLISSDDN